MDNIYLDSYLFHYSLTKKYILILFIYCKDLKAVSTKTTKERHKPPDPTAKPISVYYPADRPAIESTTSRIPIIILSTAQYQLADELIRSPVAVDTTRAAPTTTKTVNTATNDNIFILEPDSDVPVDYGEILSQIIFSSPPSPPSLSRTTLKNSDSSIDDINDRSDSADQIEANSSQPRIACRFMANIVLVFYFLLLLILLWPIVIADFYLIILFANLISTFKY